jgi:hypothetical protein
VISQDNDIQAFELPSLRLIRQVRIDGVGPLVRGIAGDWVVLSDVAGDGSPTRAFTWNLRSGQVRKSDDDVNIWGVTDDGRVLRRVIQSESRGCVDLVAVTELPTVRYTGLCSSRMTIDHTFWADLSPDGAWAVMPPDAAAGETGGPVWVPVADLRAGRWRPEASGLPENATPSFWDTDVTVIVSEGQWTYFRCRPPKPCAPLAVPVLPEGTIVVDRRG